MKRTRDEIVSAVSKQSPGAYLALSQLLEEGSDYPGDIADITALTSNMSIAAFIYPVSAFAWAYLEAHGIARYTGDDSQIIDFVDATLNGSLWGKAYT